MAERFFRATALAGDLHLIDLYDWDPWEPKRIQYRDAAEVQWLMRTTSGEHRVIHTSEALDAVIAESALPHGIYLYVDERLLDAARRYWEATKQRRKG